MGFIWLVWAHGSDKGLRAAFGISPLAGGVSRSTEHPTETWGVCMCSGVAFVCVSVFDKAIKILKSLHAPTLTPEHATGPGIEGLSPEMEK